MYFFFLLCGHTKKRNKKSRDERRDRDLSYDDWRDPDDFFKLFGPQRLIPKSGNRRVAENAESSEEEASAMPSSDSDSDIGL